MTIETTIAESEFRALLTDRTPMLDLRAPVEFAGGAVPGATNIPILNDREREKVGTEYARQGPAAAKALGYQLVSGNLRQTRVEQWSDFARSNPDGCLYCFRGGLRSEIAQQWLAEQGIYYRRVEGGYKALRRCLLASLQVLVESLQTQVLGGRTGVAKTRVIHVLPNAIDLEGLANHRGSAFGNWPTAHTRAQNFENALVVEMFDLAQQEESVIVLEDEGTNIGGVPMPAPLVAKTENSPLVILEASLNQRVIETIRGYISESLQAHLGVDPENGMNNFHEQLIKSLWRIRKRLGGVVHSQIDTQLHRAIDRHRRTGMADCHADWIRLLLTHYYDPMYDYQLAQKKDRIVFRGDRQQVEQWFAEHRTVDVTGS